MNIRLIPAGLALLASAAPLFCAAEIATDRAERDAQLDQLLWGNGAKKITELPAAK